MYELTWDAGPDCDLICSVSIEGHGCCDMREKGKFFAYKHTCKQEHIEQLGHNAFLTKEEAEAEAAKINATVQADATPSHAMTVKDSLFCLAGREMEAEELLAGLLKAQSLYVSE